MRKSCHILLLLALLATSCATRRNVSTGCPAPIATDPTVIALVQIAERLGTNPKLVAWGEAHYRQQAILLDMQTATPWWKR